MNGNVREALRAIDYTLSAGVRKPVTERRKALRDAIDDAAESLDNAEFVELAYGLAGMAEWRYLR